MSARELFHWSLYLSLCSEGSILMLKKQDLGINPYVANYGSRAGINPSLELGASGYTWDFMQFQVYLKLEE